MKLINSNFDIELINDSLYDRKGNFRSIDFEQTENELEELLRGSYERERNRQPRKQSMRMEWSNGSTPRSSWWDERPNGAGHGTYKQVINRIEGHIRKYVGRKYDDCFSDFVYKIKTNPDYKMSALGIGMKRGDKNTAAAWVHKFESYFDDAKYWPSEFMVDGDGIIRFRPSGRPRYNRHRDIVIEPEQCYYKIDVNKAVDVLPVLRVIPAYAAPQGSINAMLNHQQLTASEYSTLVSAIEQTADCELEAWNQIPAELRKQCSFSRWYNTTGNLVKYFTEKVVTKPAEVIKVGTHAWKVYQKIHARKRHQKQDHAEYEYYMRVRRYIKSHDWILNDLGINYTKIIHSDLSIIELAEKAYREQYRDVFRGRHGCEVSLAGKDKVFCELELETIKHYLSK